MKHLILLTLTWTFASALNMCKIGNEEYGDVLYLDCKVKYFEHIHSNEKNISCELNELNDVLRENVTTIKSDGCNFNEFSLFKNCTSIHLSNVHGLSTIRREIFIELKQLQLITTMDTIIELLAYAFADLPNLREVQIQSEYVKLSELAFRGAYQLKNLVIGGLTTSSLSSGLFRDLSHLEVLMLSFPSGLTDLGAIDLTGVENIKSLSFTSSQIETVTGNLLHTLKNLKYLFLNANYINSIEFSQVHSLIVLDMTGNRIKQLNATSLSGLTNLRTLILALNLIDYIENGAFSSLNKLKKLDLSYNSITVLNVDTFKGLDNLLYLRLRGNLISTINDNTFSALTKLSQLDLSDQKGLVTIDLNVFPQFIDMQTKTVIDMKISSELDDFEEAEMEWFKGSLEFSSKFSGIDPIGHTRRRFFEQFLISYQSDQIDLHNLEQNIEPQTLVIGNLDLSENRIVLINFD